MGDLDLDFIANIEQSAPQEDSNLDQDLCQDCNVALEDNDGVLVCPNCGFQPTIPQLEETEIHYDESGRAMLGQGVALTRKGPKHKIEYGWAWSTDEAIVHLLNLQITALEKLGLVLEPFRQGVKNMWFKFWIENVAPFIKDEYNDQEFVPTFANFGLKERDVEVLVKVKDEVMIPKRLVRSQEQSKKNYKMYNAYFRRSQPPDDQTSSSEDDITETANRSLGASLESLNDTQDDALAEEDITDQEDSNTQNDIQPATNVGLTRNLNQNSIVILTLNRTLAFIEATSRSMNLPDPLFASDIIRACNQRTIPFYGAHKSLPEGIRLNQKDKLMFQKTRPPSADQLTRAAVILIHRLYNDKLPFKLPVPSFSRILKRQVEDLNLPKEFFNHVRKTHIDFSCFKQTQPPELTRTSIQYPQQYDRWAYAILVGHMKKLFNLNNESIQAQKRLASSRQEETDENLFILHDWVRQMSLRIQLILSYDPFVTFHPMADISNIQPTPQVLKYVEAILGDRATSTTRAKPMPTRLDETFLAEMTDFLKRDIPRPAHIERDEPADDELERPIDVRHPIQDALSRTRRFWKEEVAKDKEISELLFKDFTDDKIVSLTRVGKWSIYQQGRSINHKILPEWPYCFKLLLIVGGFLCHCKPKKLLREIKLVEQLMNHTVARRQRSRSAD